MAEVMVAQVNGTDDRFAVMSFRAIFAGWLVATGIAVLLYVGGLALGFSEFNAWNAATSVKGIGIGTSIWLVLTWMVSLWLGGMFASWYAAHDDHTIGALHGVGVWGLSVTAVFLFIAIGLAGSMHRGAGSMHEGASPLAGPRMGEAPAPGAQPLVGDGSLAVLQADVQAHLNSHDRGASDNVVAALLVGHDDVASNLFAASNGTTSADGARIVATIAADTQAAQLDAKRRADRIAHDAATVLWIMFANVLLGLIAAALGGWVGARHIGRIYHLRTYGVSRTNTLV